VDTCAVNPTKLSFEFRVVIGTIQYTPWKGIVQYFSIRNDHVCVVLFQNGRKFWCFLFGQIENMMEWRSQYSEKTTFFSMDCTRNMNNRTIFDPHFFGMDCN
jgi:hypothetical protein